MKKKRKPNANPESMKLKKSLKKEKINFEVASAASNSIILS